MLEIEHILSNSKSISAESAIKSIIEIGNRMGPDEGESFVQKNEELLRFQVAAYKHYEKYLLDSESIASNRLLEANIKDIDAFNFLTGFGKDAYERVNDMFNHVNFDSCRRFVLVGCGSLPATIFNVHKRTKVKEIVGVDNRGEAIDTFQKIIDKFEFKNMQAVCCSGQSFDYQGTDIVYIANLVSPKHEVIDQVLETASPDIQVIVREPYSVGRLWTESLTSNLDERLEVVALGEFVPAYYSRDIIVQRKAANERAEV